jgi:hypothetical protein
VTKCELRSRTDAELPIHARQLRFDGLRADVELRRDLVVAAADCRELRDAALDGSQLLRTHRSPDYRCVSSQ